MAQQDQRTGTGTEGAASAINATSKNLQAIAGEILEISKHSFELTTKTLEKLRSAHGVDEVAAIQTDFMKEAFEHAAQHGRKFSELIATFPVEITKSLSGDFMRDYKVF